MKQKLYTLALAACAAIFPAAASANTNQVSIFDNFKLTPPHKVEIVKEDQMMMKAAPGVPSFTDTKMTRTNAAFGIVGYLWGNPVDWGGLTLYGNDIIEYLPDLDVVVYKDVDYNFAFDNSLTKAETGLRLRVYDQNGVHLSDSLDVFKTTTEMSVLGMTKILNTDPSNKDIRKCTFVYYANLFFPLGCDGYSKGHAAYVIKENNVVSFAGKDKFGPANGYDFNTFEFLKVLPNGDKFTFYSTADLSPAEGSSVSNQEPNILIGDYNKGSLNIEFIPQFQNDFERATEPRSTKKSNPVMDNFDGKIYYFTVSPFKEPEADNKIRVPAVTSSEDGGWSFNKKFEKMPKDVLKKFLKDNDLIPPGYLVDEIATIFVSFYDMAFKVYGPDKMSAITTLVLTNESASSDFLGRWLVEINKDGSNWSINIVDDFTCMRFNEQVDRHEKTFYSNTVLVVENQTKDKDPVPGVDFAIISSRSARDHEIDLATTKDGKYLVAKWIEYKYADSLRINGIKYYDTSAINTPLHTIYSFDFNSKTYKPSQNDAFLANEIMVSYREIEGGKWSKPVPLTLGNTNPNYYLHTHMPSVIPSLKNIPVFYTAGFPIKEENIPEQAKNSQMWKKNLVEYKKLPDEVMKKFYKIGRQFVYANYNVEAFSDVEEQVVTPENGIGVFPNPANSEMTIKIDSESSATVEVYNMVGAKVMSFNGVVSAVTANVSSLANGMYMVKVIENGNVRTSSFTIAR